VIRAALCALGLVGAFGVPFAPPAAPPIVALPQAASAMLAAIAAIAAIAATGIGSERSGSESESESVGRRARVIVPTYPETRGSEKRLIRNRSGIALAGFRASYSPRLMSLHDLDRRALTLARTRAHPPWAERVVGSYSRLGEHAACWLAVGTVGAVLDRDRLRRRAWLRGVRIVAGAYALNLAVKLTVRRPRPRLAGLEPLTATVSSLSFPSAHATTSFAAARAYRGLGPASALYSAAGALAVSRPYLGVHYPSDVLAGAVLGTVLAELWPSPLIPVRPGLGSARSWGARA